MGGVCLVDRGGYEILRHESAYRQGWIAGKIFRMVEFIQQYLQQAQTHGSRSTVVTPIAWLLALLLPAFLTSIQLAAPSWATILLGGLVCTVILTFLVAYAYFAVTLPDALRSEKFTLTKLAIEHSSKGDDIVGLVGSDELPRLPPPEENGGNF